MRPKTFSLLLCVVLPLLTAAQEQALPRLVGIVALPDTKLALLRTATTHSQSVMLSEQQREADLEVLRIDPEKETVQLRLGHSQARVWDAKSGRPADRQLTTDKAEKADSRVAAVEFSPDGARITTIPTNAPVTIGFDSQNKTVEPANPGLIFENAKLNEVLGVYEQLAERTLLRGSVLPAGNFNLRARVATATEAVATLEAAMAEQQISCMPDGDKFMLVVPKALAGNVRPGSSEIKADKSELLPAGVINFQNIDVVYVAQIYAELMGRKLDMQHRSKVSPQITFRTRTPMSKTEAIYGLQKVFELNGCKLLASEGDKVKLVPINE